MQLIQSIKHFAIAAAVGAITLGIVPCAAGDVKAFVGNPFVLWSDPDAWNPTGVPTAADRVIIPEDVLCYVDEDATADTIAVEQGALLFIQPDISLTLDNNDPHTQQEPDHSLIDGEVHLLGSGSVLQFVSSTHAFYGEGRVWGFSESASIEIAPDITFIDALDDINGGIRGRLTVRGLTGGSSTGRFLNYGVVFSDGDGSPCRT